MKIQLFSDMHFEFTPQLIDSTYIESFKEDDVDLVVLAGDIIPWTDMGRVNAIVQQFSELGKKLLYVMGNHEYYGTSHAALDHEWENSCDWCPKNTNIVTARNARYYNETYIYSGTMWYRKEEVAQLTNCNPDKGIYFSDKHLRSCQFSDFRYIKDNARAYEANKYFEECLSFQYDIVVTHHLPHTLSIPKQFLNEPDNCFFMCNQDKYIQAMGPKLWLFGHTHTPCDYVVHNTRIVANPKGYPNENSGAYTGKILEL